MAKPKHEILYLMVEKIKLGRMKEWTEWWKVALLWFISLNHEEYLLYGR